MTIEKEVTPVTKNTKGTTRDKKRGTKEADNPAGNRGEAGPLQDHFSQYIARPGEGKAESITKRCDRIPDFGDNPELNVPIVDVARALGLDVKRTGAEDYATCPNADHDHDDKKPGLHLGGKKNLAHCFKCSWSVDTVGLVRTVRGYNAGDAFQWIRDEFRLPGPERNRNAKPADPIVELARRRGWNVGALEALGATSENGCVVFPMRDLEGKVTGRKRRRGDNTPFAGGQKSMTGKGDHNGLFYPDPFPNSNPALVVEGEADCVAALSASWSAVVGTAGMNPGKPALEDLQRLLAGRACVLAPDPDESGAAWRDKLGQALVAVQARVDFIPSNGEDLDARLRHEEDKAAALLALVKDALPWRSPEALAGESEVANYRMETGVDKNGDPKEYTVAQSIHEIRKQLFGATGEWPRRVGPLLFHDDAGTVRFLEKHEDLTAWMQERSALSWRGGSDVSGRSLVRRGEFASHLRAKVQDYKAVEELPHEPRLEAHYYAWNPPEGYEPTGEHLAELLDFFDNPATPQDAVLIRAMFCTPVWGGSPGRRPAFVILADDRGFGKTSLAGAVADLCGGPVDLEANDRAEGRLVSRLLSPAALPKRVVRMDNIKGVAESALVESLITSRVISGYRLYHGDASRPNTLTFIVTGNALALSRDLAERAYIIRLQRPTFRAGWEAKLGAFLEEKRNYILADICAALRGEKGEYTTEDRHAEWNAGVLARMTSDPDSVLRLNAERRGECDEDISDAGIIMAALDAAADEIIRGQTEAFRASGDDSEGPGSVFLTSSKVADILAKALREPNLSTRAVRQRVQEHIGAGRLPRVKPSRTRMAKGYYVCMTGEV